MSYIFGAIALAAVFSLGFWLGARFTTEAMIRAGIINKSNGAAAIKSLRALRN